MDALLKQEFEVPCPGGGRSTKILENGIDFINFFIIEG
tara:strand:+ start:379 stop:492 length:114 start_codon:yes stop_codon:yes gene_type:complete